MAYTLEGTLHNQRFFLDAGWTSIGYGLLDPEQTFSLTEEDFDCVLLLEEIENNSYGLTLEDENGTQYKPEWFKTLKPIEEEELIDDSDLINICYQKIEMLLSQAKQRKVHYTEHIKKNNDYNDGYAAGLFEENDNIIDDLEELLGQLTEKNKSI